METWLAPVALVTHDARFAAALAVVVALGAEGACTESGDRDLSTPTQHCQLAVFSTLQERKEIWEKKAGSVA